MKEMIYKAQQEEITILEKSEYKGFEYCCLSFGTHPCAYVKLPDCYNSVDYIDVKCNGGITYDAYVLRLKNGEIENGNWIGWDYAHCNDYVGYYSDITYSYKALKKWTTKEIISNVNL